MTMDDLLLWTWVMGGTPLALALIHGPWSGRATRSARRMTLTTAPLGGCLGETAGGDETDGAETQA